MPGEHRCVDHFRSWLRKNMTGCGFATASAGAAAINYEVVEAELSGEDLPQLNSFVDEAGRAEKIAVFLFPRV